MSDATPDPEAVAARAASMAMADAIKIADDGPDSVDAVDWAAAEQVLITPPKDGDNAPEQPVPEEDGVEG